MKRQKYYIIHAKNNYGKTKIFTFENFKEIKREVVRLLDGNGWHDKDKVNLGSLRSCIDYLYFDLHVCKIQKTTSFNKFADAQNAN